MGGTRPAYRKRYVWIRLIMSCGGFQVAVIGRELGLRDLEVPFTACPKKNRSHSRLPKPHDRCRQLLTRRFIPGWKFPQSSGRGCHVQGTRFAGCCQRPTNFNPTSRVHGRSRKSFTGMLLPNRAIHDGGGTGTGGPASRVHVAVELEPVTRRVDLILEGAR